MWKRYCKRLFVPIIRATDLKMKGKQHISANTHTHAHAIVSNNNNGYYMAKANQRNQPSRHPNESKWRRVNTYAYLMVKGLSARP